MNKKLERDPNKKMIAGVAAGLAEYLGMDITLLRIIFLLLVVFGFSGILLYLILWVALPKKPFFQSYSMPYQDGAQNQPVFMERSSPVEAKQNNDSGRIVAGIALILIGTWFVLIEFDLIPNWFSLFKLWPALIIMLGLYMLFRSGKKDPALTVPDSEAKQPNPSTNSEPKLN